eukprot:scaffold18501_cov69-Phaeocystis_antarctica.AAC.2
MLGVSDQLVTDLVTSAPLELLHLLAAEDRSEQCHGVQPQSAPRESSLGKPEVSVQRETGKRPRRGVSHAGAARTPS